MSNPNPYEVAWNKLRNHLEEQAKKLPDGSIAKISALQTLFTMATLEPDEEE